MSVCTSQVHTLAHIAEATRMLGPMINYDQYCSEWTVGAMGTQVHSRSAPSQNLSSNILEIEQLKFLPHISKNWATQPRTQIGKPTDPKVFSKWKITGQRKYDSLAYPRCQLQYSLCKRALTRAERTALAQWESHMTDAVPAKKFSDILTTELHLWGRAIAGLKLTNEHDFEMVGSELNSQTKDPLCGRDDTLVRYVLRDEDGKDISYFGRIKFYLPCSIIVDDESSSRRSQESRQWQK